MRTTLTLDPDVAVELKRQMEREGKSFKHVVNEVLRAGLRHAKAAPASEFRVRPHSFGPSPGIDLDKIGQLIDELEVEEGGGWKHDYS